LVGAENHGYPLFAFVNEFLKNAQDMKYFFHAGETNWFNSETDMNLLDAILLNTTRIGHGYAILKHPKLLELVKQRQIAIEICPISNQILGLVTDLRNHPATTFIATSTPIVISSDDPALFTSIGLSHDFFLTYVVLGGNLSDLKLMKQLALNSIKYSGLNDSDKQKLQNLWQQKWNTFIVNTVKKYSL